MSTTPNVIITQTNGALGRVAAAQDGTALLVTSGVAVIGKFALGDVLGPIKSLADANALGINQAYDTANTTLVFQHVKDFFIGAGEGNELYVMVLVNTITMAQMCDKALTNAATALQFLAGKIKLLAIARIPNTVGALADQFEADLMAAVTKAQELAVSEFAEPRHRPIQILLEGRNFQGSASTAKDFRTMASNRVSVVISQDKDVSALNAAYNKYANVGYALGVLAAQPVQRNIGRVKNGTLKIGKPALSNGALIETISDVDQETLNAKGIIFVKKYAGKDGIFFNDDHTCVAVVDDYAYISNGRAMDKASRITRTVYLEELNDDIEVDETTGKLAVSTIKQFQGIVETAINSQMTANGEISGVKAFVDANQNIATTSTIITNIAIRKKGTSRYIDANLSFATTIN